MTNKKYMKISVLIPTYKRPKYLMRCLSSLERQTRLPDEVVVVARDTDIETQRTLQEFMKKSRLNIQKTFVTNPGVIPAENAGLNIITGDIVCFLDDDTEAFEDWLQRIEKYYLDDNIGGVGGRIILYDKGQLWKTKKVERVGRVAYFGRLMGNSYQDVANAQYVDFLHGCNMSFRRKLIYKIDPNIKGDGFNFEVHLGLMVKEKKYKLIFEPKIRVKHFGAPRHEGSREDVLERCLANAHNTTYIMLKHFYFIRKIVFLLYFLVIGDVASPGFLKILHLIYKNRTYKFLPMLFYATYGKFQGILSYERHF